MEFYPNLSPTGPVTPPLKVTTPLTPSLRNRGMYCAAAESLRARNGPNVFYPLDHVHPSLGLVLTALGHHVKDCLECYGLRRENAPWCEERGPLGRWLQDLERRAYRERNI